MKKLVLGCLLPAAMAVALVATSCSGDSEPAASADPSRSSTTTSTTAAPIDPECTVDHVGGSTTMAVISETAGLDPVVSTGSGATGGTELAAIYDTIMRWDPASGRYEPRLAESLTPNADYGEWTLTLKAGLHFGNGDPFTTAAVEASVNRHKDPEMRSTSHVVAALIDSMRIVDERTMVFTLVAPWSEFPFVLGDKVGMVPNPAVIDALGREQFNRAPVGAGVGPYEVERFTPGEGVTLAAKDDYWGGPVCIQELRFVARGTAATTYEAFDAGEVDVAYMNDPQMLQRLSEDGAESHSDVLGGQVIMMNSGMRGSTPPTSDLDVRRAVLAAIDPEAIAQRVNRGTAEATSALFGEKSLYHNDIAGPETDLQLARQLVDAAKAARSWDGSIRLTCAHEQADLTLTVKTSLDAVGFKVETDLVGTTADLIQKVLIDANYELACWSVQLFDSGVWNKLDRFLRSDSLANRMGYSSPEMDAALADFRVADDVEARRTVIGRIQTLWNETAPGAIVAAVEPTIVWSDDLRGLTFTQETVVYFDKAYIAS